MPRIKRYFPVSQTINTDPEVRRLKKELGVTGFSMWLEILARTDQGPVWKGSENDIGGILAGVCESNTRGSARLLQWVTDTNWIAWQRGSEAGNRWGLIVVNHAEYHRSKEHKKAESGNSKEPPPSEPSEPSQPKRPEPPNGRPVENSNRKRALDPEIKEVADRLFESDRTRFRFLIKWIRQKEAQGFEPSDIAQALRELEDRQTRMGRVEDFWAYLEGKGNGGQSAVQRVRTRRLQAESAGHKNRPPMESWKNLFDRMNPGHAFEQ